MSLFIGNISSSVSVTELEKAFGEYGRCSINYKGSYAFAEYDHEKEAEESFNHLHNKLLGGREINIEWSKKSKRFDESKCKRRRRSSSRQREGRCYNCGKRGHFLRDCKHIKRRDHHHRKSRSKSRSRSRSRSRSHSRRRRSTSRDRRHRKNKRKSHSSKSSRSRSHSYKKKRSTSNRKKSDDKSPNRYDKKNNHASQEMENNKTSTAKEGEKDNNSKEKSDMYTSKLAQILGNDFSEQKPSEGEENINSIQNITEDKMPLNEKNGNVNINSNEMKNGETISEDIKNWDMSKLRNECKKRSISLPKNSKKSELIDLLLKKGE